MTVSFKDYITCKHGVVTYQSNFIPDLGQIKPGVSDLKQFIYSHYTNMIVEGN